MRMEFGYQRAKHDGSEHDPGSHLTDDRRLADEAQQRRQQPRRCEDDDQLQQEWRVDHSAVPRGTHSLQE